MAGHARLACDEAGHWDERLGEGRTGRPARRGQRGGFGGQNSIGERARQRQKNVIFNTNK